MDFNNKETSCKDCVVKSSPIYNLNTEELELLCKNSTNVIFGSGEKIIKEGTFTQNVIFVKSGIYKLHLKGPLNKDEILKIEKGPHFIGLPDVFANKIHSYSVTAMESLH